VTLLGVHGRSKGIRRGASLDCELRIYQATSALEGQVIEGLLG
jgi:hypothetical protein